MAGLRKRVELMVIVVTLLTYGCPLQAIVHAVGVEERSVAKWRDRAGLQCERVQQASVVQHRLDVQHVQADEVRAKGAGLSVWMAMALQVSSRRWLGGVVSLEPCACPGGPPADPGAQWRQGGSQAAALYRRLGAVAQQ